MTARAELEAQFHADMVRIYDRARTEADYVATRFIQMVANDGGVETARRLVAGDPSDGFTALWERDRLDLTVEALVLAPRYRRLFDASLRRAARRRLEDYGADVEVAVASWR